jgi:uncharacterized RDD family membrane protein YckC
MNIFTLQRLSFLAVLPLCALILAATAPGARAAEHDHDGGNNVVDIGHDANLPSGQQADSVVSIFGSSTSDGDAGTVVSIMGNTRVTGEVHDTAVSVLGSTYVDGKVDGDAVAVLGNLELGPHAEIGGDVVAVGGMLVRDPAAIVHGNVQNIVAVDFGGFDWLHTWIRHCLLLGRPLALVPGLDWAWGLALAFLVLYAGLALLFREGLSRCVETFERRPGQTVLAALIAMLATPVLVVLLFATVIGIAAVPFVLFGLLCVGLFGKAVMLAWVGRRVTGRQGSGPLSHPALAVLIGGAVVLLLYLVPLVGFLVYKLLGILGLGAVVYTAVEATRAHQAARAARPASAVPPAVPPSSAPDAVPTAGMDSAPGAAPGAAPDAAPDAAPAAQTSPPITAALPRAGFCVRMGALLIDALLVIFVTHLVHSHLELVLLAVYGAVMWKLRGSTIGGLIFDLQVVRSDGRAMDWETAIIRALGCFLSLVVVGLGFIWIAFDDNRQAWHDKIAGTVVVRVAKAAPLV